MAPGVPGLPSPARLSHRGGKICQILPPFGLLDALVKQNGHANPSPGAVAVLLDIRINWSAGAQAPTFPE
jgi:hypothetical protein